MRMILSPDNKLIKQIFSLHSSRGRKKFGQYILEGQELVREALPIKELELVVLSPELLSGSQFLAEKYPEIRSIECSEKIFRKISTFDSPRGILAVLKIPEYEVEKFNLKSPSLILEEIQDPGNVGNLIRSSEAFGFENIIILEGTADPYSPRCSRASMGSQLRSRIFSLSWQEFLDLKKKNNIELWGLDVKGEKSIETVRMKFPFALVLGSEGGGLSEKMTMQLKGEIQIPMQGNLNSLNVSSAGSIAMFMHRNIEGR